MRPMIRTIVVGASAAVFALAAIPAVSTQGTPGTGPVNLSRDEDFQRTRALLGLTGPPPAGAVSSSPDTFNEATANPYPNLPDPLKMNDGRRVTSAAMWNNQRRTEILEIFEREIYGRTPKTTPKVTWHVIGTTNETNGGVPVITKELVGHVENSAFPGITVNIQASLSTPATATGPVPVILSFSAS